jgi:hypothetical protein
LINETSLFDEMYNATGSESMEVVLPPRDSSEHRLVTTLARLIQVEGTIATREDILPDSSEPGKKSFINHRGPFALQQRSVNFLVSRMTLGCAIALGVFAALAVFFFYRSRRAAHN